MTSPVNTFPNGMCVPSLPKNHPLCFAMGKPGSVCFSHVNMEHTFRLRRIPQAWLTAIVAAEDKRFWEHGGVDI